MLPSEGFQRRSVIPEYIRRLVHYPQMDIEYTSWMMFYLCFNPARVYRTTSWHKQTKNQWARDDPAFVAILSFFLGISSISYGIAFKTFDFLHILKLLFWTIFIDFLLIGCLIATIGWFLSNKYLKNFTIGQYHTVEQNVEWLYAFDIHCNSFFPAFVILHVLQFFLLPILMYSSILSTLLANTLYVIALVYYYHITFLGYNVLPFLKNTVFFLYPIGVVLVLFVLSLIFNFNVTIWIINFYFA